jgi:hypothetical protein
MDWNMNDFDLETRLMAVCVPERSAEYWDDFPSQVRMQLARRAREERVSWQGGPRAWNRDLALAGVLLVFSLMPVFYAALKDEGILRQEASRWSHGIRMLMADQHGMQNVVTDSE